MTALHFFSLSTAPIEVYASNGKKLQDATGFFYSQDEEWAYFVTNWHVVTDRYPTTPAMSNHGAIPTTLRIFLYKDIGSGKISLSQLVQVDIKVNDDSGDAPEWLEHPDHKYKVDLVVIKIPLNDLASEVKFNCLADYSFMEDFTPSPMNDVFIIGYPWGLSGGGRPLPIYKRGSVASEPIVDHDGLPRFLIDSRSAAGMSGAPAICTHSGIWNKKGNSMKDAVIGTVENFSGVYSGRLRMKTTEEEETFAGKISEIGLIWKKEALLEILAGGIPGTGVSDLS